MFEKTIMEDMNSIDYQNATNYIKENLDEITKFVNALISEHDFLDALAYAGCEEDFLEFDYWHSYGDNVDLNFVGSEDGLELKCLAYPVVNSIPNYDQEYQIEIKVEVK